MLRKCAKSANTVTALFMSLLLSVMMVPVSAYAQPAKAQVMERPTASQIQDMLSGRTYIEGDAIVVAEAGANLSVARAGENIDCEELTEVSDTAMELTAESAKSSDDQASVLSAERAEKSDATGFEISIVHSDELSTAELIGMLYENPAVISVSPNYVTESADAYEAEGNGEAATSFVAGTFGAAAEARGDYKPFGVHDPDVADLSSLQWSLGGANNLAIVNTLEGQDANVGLDVPGYNGRGGGTENSDEDATIAVLDSGMDLTHPDLQNVFYTFSEEQQSRFGCGEHGYNATVPRGDTKAGDLTDTLNHGTHVSGIMSAAWDGKGVAGVANGAKLIGVRLSGDDSSQSGSGTIRGFEFATEIAKEVNLKAVNCSWGSDIGSIEFIFTLLVNNLGEQGVVTVFAAGNDSVDSDQEIETPSFIESPYLLSVGCLSPSGDPSFFSNWGEASVDVFAPGAAILSTVPAKTASVNYDDYYNCYYPQADQGVLSCVRFSDGTEGGVTVYNDDPIEHPEAIVSAQVSDDVGLDDEYSLKIPHDQFHPQEDAYSLAHHPEEYVYMKIPAGTADPSDISYVSAQFIADFGKMSVHGTLYGFMGKTANGRPKIVNFDDEESQYYSTASVRTNKAAWGNATLNIGHMLEADGEADEVYLDDHENMIVIVRLWEDVVLKDYTPVEALYVDDITVGSSEGHPSNHMMFNGTSMAAPAVTASCAVVSRGEAPSASCADEDLAMQAIKRSARLRAATAKTEILSDKCATGGFVRLTGYGSIDAEAAPMAPTIKSAEVKNGIVEAEGWFFGTSGRVFVDGVEGAPTSWADDKVTFALPQDVQNGRRVLTIATDEGQDKLQLNVSEASGHGSVQLYEHELSTPDLWASDYGIGPNGTSGGLCASGNYIYTFQRNINKNICAFWRYDIAADTWELCPLPLDEPVVYDSDIAATDTGVVFFTRVVAGQNEYGADLYQYVLFDYDAASNSWKRRDLDVELPDATGIFSRGKDLFFVDSQLPNDEGGYDHALLSVLRDGSDHLEMLGEMPPDFEYSIYFASLMIAAGGRYVYLSGSEPITDGNSGTPSPKALFRLTLDEDDHVIDMDALVGELVELGIAAKGDGLLYPAVAAGPCGGIIVGGNGEIASDTFLWKGGSDVLEAQNRTSSYFRSNLQTAVYHEGKLYALGYSPSEDGKMFFRATDLEVDHVWDEGVVTTEPTETKAGVKTFTCERCRETRTEAVPPTGTSTLEVFAGNTRFATARMIVDAAVESGPRSGVIVVGGQKEVNASGAETKYPDALSAAGLAGMLDYPLVMVDGRSLNAQNKAALQAVKDSNGGEGLDILIVGGPKAVSDKVVDQLAEYGAVSDRIYGNTRYATNRAVYEYGRSQGAWNTENVFVATGENFPDALAIAPYLAWKGAPIVLAKPTDARMLAAAAETLRSADNIIALGADNAKTLPSSQLEALGMSYSERLAGKTRYQTGAEIVEWELAHGMTVEGAGVATGANFPDALASGYLLGCKGSVLCLVSPVNSQNAALRAVLATVGEMPLHVRIFGGENAISSSKYADIASWLGIGSYEVVKRQ